MGDDDDAAAAARLAAQLRRRGRAGGTLPRLRTLATDLEEALSQRWPQVRVPDYPALAGPGAVLAQVPAWWQPEG